MFEFITKKGKQFFVNGWIAGFVGTELKKIPLNNEIIPKEKFKAFNSKNKEIARDALCHFTDDPGFSVIALDASIQDAWTGERKTTVRMILKEHRDVLAQLQ